MHQGLRLCKRMGAEMQKQADARTSSRTLVATPEVSAPPTGLPAPMFALPVPCHQPA